MVETSTRIHLPILRSKLNPPLGGRYLVGRDRLNAWLETEDLPRVIVARAPAGFGKSTLMVQWYRILQQRGARVSWISLEEPENDPGQFLAYLVASLQMGIPELGLAESVSDPMISGGGTQGTILYLVDKLSEVPGPFTLFLDDFDVIRNETVLKLVQQLINYLPLGKRLVVGLRQSPALGLVKMQATGELLEIGIEDLRFTREESSRFLRQVPDLGLDEQDIESIQSSMEGWIAGLQLTTISTWRENPKNLVRKHMGAFNKISVYLAEDVLSRQPEEVETFLLQTSVLNRLCGPLCNAVTGRSDSYRMLDHLERANLFIVPLDEERRWYRYHTLFAKFLRNRLERKGEDQVRKLHALAAQWYLQEGNFQEAAQHALDASDFDAAAEMMDRCATGMLEGGLATTLIKWGRTIPPQILARYRELVCTYIYALIFVLQYEQATTVIDWITEIWSNSGKEALVASLRPMRAQILIFTDKVDECERVVDDDQWQGDEHAETDRVTLLTRGAIYNIGCVVKISAEKFEEALKCYSRGAAIGRRIEMLQPEPLIHNIYNKWVLANLEFTQGRLQEALDILRAVQERIENEPARYSIAAATVSITKAEILYEMNEIGEAEKLLHSFSSLLEVASPPDGVIIALRTLARIHASRGEWTTAVNYLTDLERLGVELDVERCGATARLEKSRMAIVRGDVEEAVQISRNSDDGGVWRRFSNRCMRANDPETPELSSLRIVVAKGHARESIDALNTAIKQAEASGRKRQLILSRLLLVKAYESCGERRSALRALKETVVAAQTSGFIRSFIDEGEPVRTLLRELQGATLSSGQRDLNEELPLVYLQRILKGFGGVDPAPKDASGLLPPLQDVLTDREIAILEQLAKGLSNEEIADKLFISVHTVRSHLRNIHSKLGATNRTQAVALARSHGLII